ncbi:MAG TPA: tRNA pseudouridine(38-40) synthase TruA, partial [Chitinophagales bacterium]|nr:tRNA pseudouridine(38-40) synthase TruA [Chitinophagales bacterium]
MRYFIELAYDGSAFSGWQIQENSISVQQVIEDALSTILRQKIDIVGCGRTDAGVHAHQYFAHFD